SPYNDSVWDGIRGDCGVPRIKPDLKRGRIVGGDEAVANSWPWQISLVKYISFGDGYASLKHICGGTLIGPNTVISATHCFLNRDRTQTTTKADSYRVIVGGHDKSKLTKGAKMSKIAQIIHHPLNNLATFSKQRVAPVNDISLLKLVNSYNPSRTSPVVAFACLPKPKVFPPVGKRCWSSGWGRTMYTGSDDVLKQLPQPIVSQQLCTKFYSNMISYDKHLCALESAAGTCQGDSGGPLVCQGSDMKWSLYGATSFGPVPCATAPGVFSSVANYIEWLCCHMDETGPCAKIACKLP
uniref:Peptidase S1 domain-containing protein n=2 Tax=Ciona intestinalis TaxID=7719 RepID=F6QYD5_CIOIN